MGSSQWNGRSQHQVLTCGVFSQPFGGDQQGGDVYYVTLCGGGLITRIVVADVSGHGAWVANFR